MPRYPLARLDVQSFAAFAELKLSFSTGLNVIVGDNGAGKSQLLKLLYACSAVLGPSASWDRSGKGTLNREVARKLVEVFRPETLGRLTNRVRGRARADVSLKWEQIGEPLRFSFATNSRSEVSTESVPRKPLVDTPVFLPTRELMSIYPGFASLYRERVLEYEETWLDTAVLLGRPSLRGPRTQLARQILEPIEEVLGGTIREVGGRFYLHQEGIGNIEMHLVAEGLRKLAMLVRLVQSGTLLEGGYLFWDEPEANLNPRTLTGVARMIHSLVASGVQVFVGTHSTFLLRELDMIQQESSAGMKVIGLARRSEGVVAEEADDVDDLPIDFLAALEAEIEQTNRYLRA